MFTRRSQSRWIGGLAGGLLLGALVFASAGTDSSKAKTVRPSPTVQIISPTVPQSWAYGDMTNHRLVWDDSKKELRADLTFSDQLYNSNSSGGPQPEMETYECPFPKVTFDPKTNLFSATNSKGLTIPVARRKDVLFGTEIELLPTSRVTIYNLSGKLIVVLSGTTNQAFATGMNKWIVRPKGWYLQAIY